MTSAVNKGLQNPSLSITAINHPHLTPRNQGCLLQGPPRALKWNLGFWSKPCSSWFLPCNVFTLYLCVCVVMSIYTFMYMCTGVWKSTKMLSSITVHLVVWDRLLMNLGLTNLSRPAGQQAPVAVICTFWSWERSFKTILKAYVGAACGQEEESQTEDIACIQFQVDWGHIT